jgi:hypothetical protein
MSVATLDSPLQFADRRTRALRPVPDPASSFEQTADADFQPWELHSELVLVCPELRRRSLELLPEHDPDASPVGLPEPLILPAAAAPPEELAPRAIDLLRYTLQRLGALARSGFTIIGAVFVLAMLAEILTR